MNKKTIIWNSPSTKQLAVTLAAIDDVKIIQNFLRDAMTEKEITEISARFEAARMLQAGDTYTNIELKTKLSSRTIARISNWLQNGCNGYKAAFAISTTHYSHIPPVRAA